MKYTKDGKEVFINDDISGYAKHSGAKWVWQYREKGKKKLNPP